MERLGSRAARRARWCLFVDARPTPCRRNDWRLSRRSNCAA
jgi:hypothetical protein